MHAAQGAYWNVEKDGMWSYKYEAAETKGLDVVIGIVWIWIGTSDSGASATLAAPAASTAPGPSAVAA